MIIKIDTDAGDYKGIPVVIDGETVGHISDAPELLKKMLQVMFEDMDDLRSDIKEKDNLIEQLLEDEQERDNVDEIECGKDESEQVLEDEQERDDVDEIEREKDKRFGNEGMIKKQDPIAVANFIIENALERKKPVTNSQLQKIMLLLQGYWLEKTGQELFCEKINHGRWRPLIFSVEKEFKCYASAPIKNKFSYFCFDKKEPAFKAPTVDQKVAKKLKTITNTMLDYDRINLSNLFFENDRDKQPTVIKNECTKQTRTNFTKYQRTWTNFIEYQPDEIIQKYRDVTEKLAKC